MVSIQRAENQNRLREESRNGFQSRFPHFAYTAITTNQVLEPLRAFLAFHICPGGLCQSPKKLKGLKALRAQGAQTKKVRQMQNKSWREAIQDAFEHADQFDEQTTIITGLLLFEAIRNSHPHAGVDDIIIELSQAICISLGLKKLLNRGLVESFVASDGLTCYRAFRAAH